MTLNLNGVVYLYEKGVNILLPLQSLFLLLIRLYWGYLFAQAGFGKLTNLERTGDFFSSLGLPFPGIMALLIGFLEFLGGILIFLGLGTRLVALLLVSNMIGAFLVAHRDALSNILSDPYEFYSALPFTFLYTSLVLFLFGGGKLSLDEILKRFFGSRIR